MLSYMKGGTAAHWAKRYMNRPVYSATAVRGTCQCKKFEDFLKEFEAVFRPKNEGETARSKLDRLVQGKSSVDAYNAYFNDLAVDAKHNDTTLVHLYIKGLDKEIKKHLIAMDKIPEKLLDIQDKAAEFYHRGLTRSNDRGTITPADMFKEEVKNRGTCENPIMIEQRFVRLSNNQCQEYMKSGKCFQCGKTGHVARNCPERKTRSNPNFIRPPNRYVNQYRPKGNNGPMRNRAAQVQDILDGATAEDLNEMALALKDTTPAEEPVDFGDAA